GEEVSENTISFSSQKVNADQLNVAQGSNIKEGLAGKVAGVQIVGQAGSKLGAFGDIRIRGAISLTNDLAEPLYIVDGVPVTNPNIIDMNNVSDVNVLKGPNATALYGQRGENGVVLITTKDANATGVSVELSNALTIDQIAYTPKFQNEYAGGYAGEAELQTFNYDPTVDPDYFKPLDGMKYIFDSVADESWGPKMDGREYAPWYAWFPDSPYYAQAQKLSPRPNNVKDFYDTGVTNKSSFAINYTSDRSSARVSYTNMIMGGIIPYSDLNKHYLAGQFSYDVTDNFTVKANVNYTLQDVLGNVRADGYGNQVSGTFNNWFERQINVKRLQELKDLHTPEGYQTSWNWWGPRGGAFGLPYGSSAANNGFKKPAFWFNAYTFADQHKVTRDRNNLLYNVNLSYKINDQWEVTGSANRSVEDYKWRREVPYSIEYSAAPEVYNPWVNSFGIITHQDVENDYHAKVKYNNNFGDWSVDAFGGSTMRIQHYNYLSAVMDEGNYQSGGLIIPDVYQYSNSAERIVPDEHNWDKQVFSLYAKGTFGYKDMVYLDGSYRQDWSSALPSNNNGYGYPSVGLSFVFSELLQSDIISYGKVRAGWAQVGNDVAAEKILSSYALDSNPYTNPATGNSAPLLYTDDTIVDPNIKPAINSSFETGFDIRFFDDRVGLNATYYHETRKDEIIGVSLSTSNGAGSYLTNAGTSKRDGIELSLNGVPVRTHDFRWDATLNFAKNKTIVTSLPQGLDTYEIDLGSGNTNAFSFVNITHKRGEEWGQIRGAAIRRADNGDPILNSNGLYVVDQGQFFGSVLPDWTGGMVNTFSYKGLGLTAAVDFQKGGKFFSLTEMWGTYTGILDRTAGLNDKGNPKRDAVADGGGVHVTGQDVNGNAVDMYVNAHTYFDQWYSNRLAEPFIHDASYVKLRELSLTYSLPKRWLGGFINSAKIGVVGRNLWLIAVSGDNHHRWDPSELAQTWGENAQLPGTRSFGFNVNVTF
ncbi:MAG: SusC/RagA family TonB-linked outer membrane protein, partial [Balneolaceae bacterium]